MSAPARWILVLLIALGGAWVSIDSAAAQDGRAQVRAELEQTQRGIDRVADFLHNRPCVAGSALLDRAREAQSRALDLFRRDQPATDRAAVVQTRQARKLVNQAIQSCSGAAAPREDLLGLLRSTQDLVDECTERARASAEPEALRLATAAQEQLGRARDAYARQNLRGSVRHLAIARGLAQRGLQKVRGHEGGEQERMSVALDRGAVLLAELRVALSEEPNASAQALADRAEAQLDRARELGQAGRLRGSIRAAALGRALALEAHWLLSRGNANERVERAIDAVGELLEDIAADLPSDAAPERADLETARGLWSEASAALKAGELERAEQLCRLAEAAARRAAGEAGTP